MAHISELAVLVREAAAHKLRAAGSLAIDGTIKTASAPR